MSSNPGPITSRRWVWAWSNEVIRGCRDQLQRRGKQTLIVARYRGSAPATRAIYEVRERIK